MQIQDRIDGMKKLLDRESQRCQGQIKFIANNAKHLFFVLEMVKNAPIGQLSAAKPADGNDSENPGESGNADGLKSIIDRQNQIIEQYRLKVLKLEEQVSNMEKKL